MLPERGPLQAKVIREGCQKVSSLFGESRAYRVLGLGLIAFRAYRVLGLGFRPLHLVCPNFKKGPQFLRLDEHVAHCHLPSSKNRSSAPSDCTSTNGRLR